MKNICKQSEMSGIVQILWRQGSVCKNWCLLYKWKENHTHSFPTNFCTRRPSGHFAGSLGFRRLDSKKVPWVLLRSTKYRWPSTSSEVCENVHVLKNVKQFPSRSATVMKPLISQMIVVLSPAAQLRVFWRPTCKVGQADKLRHGSFWTLWNIF